MGHNNGMHSVDPVFVRRTTGRELEPMQTVLVRGDSAEGEGISSGEEQRHTKMNSAIWTKVAAEVSGPRVEDCDGKPNGLIREPVLATDAAENMADGDGLGLTNNTDSSAAADTTSSEGDADKAGALSVNGNAGVVPEKKFGYVDADCYARLIPANEDLPGDRAAAADTTEAKAPQPSEHSIDADSTADSSSLDKPVSDEEQCAPQLSKLALGALLDELSGELIALEDFDGEVDDRAFEGEWLGRHTAISLTVFRADFLKTGTCTCNVDENGVLLDDPVKYRLALEVGAQITLRVHRALSEAQKSNFILLTQGRDRVRSEAENRELKRRIILAGLVQGLTYESISEMAGVHQNTVRNVAAREATNPTSKLGITQRPDGRFNPETLAKIAAAAELRKAGMAHAEIAVMFDTDVESVDRWFTPDKAKKAKSGKGKKTAATKPAQPIEDIAAGDGVPERHRRALEHLGLNASPYAEWLKEAVEKAQKDSGAVAGDLEESVKSELYFTQRAEVEKSRQRKILSPAAEIDAKEAASSSDSWRDKAGSAPDTILLGTVMAAEPPEVFVALPVGGGVIDNRDDCLDWHAPLEVSGVVRVRVEGFDWKRGLWKLQPLGRQTPAPAPGAAAARFDRDDRCSPDTKLAGLKAGPKNNGVTR